MSMFASRGLLLVLFFSTSCHVLVDSTLPRNDFIQRNEGTLTRIRGRIRVVNPPDISWDAVLRNELPDPPEEVIVDPNAPLFYGALHDVVGRSGVLMIHLDPEKNTTSVAVHGVGRSVTTKALVDAGIVPTIFPATGAQAVAPDILKQGCLHVNDADTYKQCTGDVRFPPKQMGYGCSSTVEQAIADSHRRALLAAADRAEEWTAIIEDDVLPSHLDNWSNSFKRAWANMPPEAKFVRLGWCTFADDVGPVTQHVVYDDGDFRIIDWMSVQDNWYYTGGCTTGYIVHKSIIPQVLGIFPCCGPVDSCFEQELFYSPPFCRKDMSCNGQKFMVSLDAFGSTSFAAGRTSLKEQAGVLVQDNTRFISSRPMFNQTS